VYRNHSSERGTSRFLKVKFDGGPKNKLGIGARITVYAGNRIIVNENMPCRGFQSATESSLTIGVDTVSQLDSIVIRWPNLKTQLISGVKTNKTITVKIADATRDFIPSQTPIPLMENNTARVFTTPAIHTENSFTDFDREKLIPRMISTEGPRLAAADINGDGLTDFLLGNGAGDAAKLFVQLPDGTFIPHVSPALERDKQSETIGAQFFDADADGDNDLVMVSGGNELAAGDLQLLARLYLNDGIGNFTRAFKGWPMLSVNASCVQVADINADKLPDLFIGARSVPGTYGVKPSSVLLLNKGAGNFLDVTAEVAPALHQLGMVTTAAWERFGDDQLPSLVVAGDWMPVSFFQYRKGQLVKTKEIENSSGWWNSLAVADLNGDGLNDLIVGNRGENSRIRADGKHPARLFVDDFDKNGQVECVPAYYKADGISYPFNLRNDLMAQMPIMKKKFLYYSSYAGKSIDEVLTPAQRESASVMEVKETRSMLYYGKKGGGFDPLPLPVEAQLAPVFAIAVTDINRDGKPDLVLGGNLYGLKPETGRYDASETGTFINTGRNGFSYIGYRQSGIRARGEIRDIREIKTSGGYILMVAVNNAPVQVFTKKQ
ncbi:MAG: RNA-binding protein, partial [Chitinophagaceae bacterium]